MLRDITVGNNDTGGLLGGQYKAGPGWDACTGWGVPDGGKLLTALQGGPTSSPIGSGAGDDLSAYAQRRYPAASKSHRLRSPLVAACPPTAAQ